MRRRCARRSAAIRARLPTYIHAEETRRTKDQIIPLCAKHCGRTCEEVERTVDRDRFMTPEAARDWGLIDEVLSARDIAASDRPQRLPCEIARFPVAFAPPENSRPFALLAHCFRATNQTFIGSCSSTWRSTSPKPACRSIASAVSQPHMVPRPGPPWPSEIGVQCMQDAV